MCFVLLAFIVTNIFYGKINDDDHDECIYCNFASRVKCSTYTTTLTLRYGRFTCAQKL